MEDTKQQPGLTLPELINRIKKQLYKTHRHIKLCETTSVITQLNSAFDVIEDTDLAINTYYKYIEQKQAVDPMSDSGKLYLLLYGVLQSMFVQQNAIKAIFKAIGSLHKGNNDEHTQDGDSNERLLSDVKKYEEAFESDTKAIKEIRHTTAGHPTSSDGEAHWIVRSSMQYDSYELLTYNKNGELSSMSVNISDLIKTQNKAIISLIQNLDKELELEDQKHKKEYGKVRLSDNCVLWNNFLVYIGDAICNPTSSTIQHAKSSMIQLNEQVDKCFTLCKERGELDAPSWKLDIGVFRYALQRLNDLLDSPESDQKLFELHTCFDSVTRKVENIWSSLVDIDKKYS